jgi:hypothetical protein
MKITQFLKYAGIVAIAAFTFACGSDDSPAPDTKPKVTSLSPTTGTVGTTVTVNGSNLSAPDSVKLGKSKVTISNNTGSSFKFTVPASAFTGKVYVYKGGAVDSSQTFTVSEPTGPVPASTLTCFLNGKEFSGTTFAENDTIAGNPVLLVGGVVGTSTIVLTLPNRLALNQTIPASTTNQFFYSPDLSNASPILFSATGLNGTSGSFTVTEIGANGTYLRGTFNFLGISTGGSRANVTNGRLALRLQ